MFNIFCDERRYLALSSTWVEALHCRGQAMVLVRVSHVHMSMALFVKSLQSGASVTRFNQLCEMLYQGMYRNSSLAVTSFMMFSVTLQVFDMRHLQGAATSYLDVWRYHRRMQMFSSLQTIMVKTFTVEIMHTLEF